MPVTTQRAVSNLARELTRVVASLRETTTDIRDAVNVLSDQSPQLNLVAVRGAAAPLDAIALALEELVPSPPLKP